MCQQAGAKCEPIDNFYIETVEIGCTVCIVAVINIPHFNDIAVYPIVVLVSGLVSSLVSGFASSRVSRLVRMTPPKDIFISYRNIKPDKDLLDYLEAWLKHHGYGVFRDETDVPPGRQWEKESVRALCSAFFSSCPSSLTRASRTSMASHTTAHVMMCCWNSA